MDLGDGQHEHLVLGTWGGGATAPHSSMKGISFQWLTYKNWHTLSQWSPGKDEDKKVNHHLSSFEPAHFQLIISKAWTEESCHIYPMVLMKLIKVLSIWFDGLVPWGKLIGTKRVESRYSSNPCATSAHGEEIWMDSSNSNCLWSYKRFVLCQQIERSMLSTWSWSCRMM